MLGSRRWALAASALADGDSIDDADALRSGECGAVVGQWSRSPRRWARFGGRSAAGREGVPVRDSR